MVEVVPSRIADELRGAKGDQRPLNPGLNPTLLHISPHLSESYIHTRGVAHKSTNIKKLP